MTDSTDTEDKYLKCGYPYLHDFTREELWQVVQEAKDYLASWLENPYSSEHPTYGPVVVEPIIWGVRYDGKCRVCLAGLWYLQKKGILLGEVYDRKTKPNVAEFLDDLRYPDIEGIENLLGVKVPDEVPATLIEKGPEDRRWSSNDPRDILLLLDWLLGQRETSTTAL